MRRAVPLLVLAGVAAGALVCPSLGATSAVPVKKGPLQFTVTLKQQATYRHDNPPAGDAGDTFSTTLLLYASGDVLGYPDGTPMGKMLFTWGPLKGSCSTTAASCTGTPNLQTVTRLPGGTITANGTNIPVANGLVVAVQGGTGIFKGVRGTISIAPQGVAEDVFNLKMS